MTADAMAVTEAEIAYGTEKINPTVSHSSIWASLFSWLPTAMESAWSDP